MRAVIVTESGGIDGLTLAEVPDPQPGPDEVVLDVHAAGVNRADLMQRGGHYPPPPGASDLLGLECSGVVSAIGSDVVGWAPGDQVCALLAGGGYAEKVAVPAGQVVVLPGGVGLVTAAALPEVAATVWSNVFMLAHLRPDETLLVHGGAGGIGTMAIQLAHALGSTVLTTAGSDDKLERCRALGADVGINYRDTDFVAAVRDVTDGRGADVILDVMGGSYLPRNVDCLATEGRLVVIGLQGGRTGELPLGTLMAKRGAVLATTLRARPREEKATIMASVVEHVWPLVADGTVEPIVDRAVPLEDVREAHMLLEASGHIGKVLLVM
ncbi:MAG: NAD(P)H-quinone oxidoreductase [Nocardioidaceae bacterium]